MRDKKSQRTLELPERLALNSPFHIPLRGTSCVSAFGLRWPRSLFKMEEGSVYARRNITLEWPVNRCISAPW